MVRQPYDTIGVANEDADAEEQILLTPNTVQSHV